MRLELDDPRLMDYVLGELEDGEARNVAAALELDENKDARELVEELRGVADTARRVLHEEDGDVALSEEQRAAIVGTVGVAENVVPLRKRLLNLVAGIAAIALFAFATAVFVPTYGGKSLQPAPLKAQLEETARARSSELDALQVQLAPVAESPVESAPTESGFGGGGGGFERETKKAEPKKMQAKRPESQSSNLQNVEVGGAIRIQGNFDDNSNPFFNGGEDSAFVEAEARPEPAPSVDTDGDGLRAGNDYFQYALRPGDEQVQSENLRESALATAQAEEAPMVEARNRLEMKANLSEGLSLTYENEGDHPAPAESAPPEEHWAEYNVGNLTGQTALPEQVASHMPEDISPFEGNMSAGKAWQWNTPTDKPTEIVGGPGTETYVKVAGVKPFVAVKDEPLSTFSIDVDTAAYSNVRRFLSAGQLPPADAVRIEEMVNYFRYAYAQPVDGRPFAVSVMGAPAPWAQERQLVRIGIKGKEVPQSERPQANLVFLIDASGSMSDANKLPLVKESMKTLLSQLRPNDRVGIVTYAGDARLVLGSTPCSEAAAITQAIDSLNAGGGTNGGGGIQMAYDLAQSNFNKEGINRVIMATDGDFNVGTTSHGDLMGLIESRAKSGVFLTTLGFGMGNLKDSTLEQLANRGNGNYAYIDNHAEARKALVDQLSGTLQTIAKDVKIQVEFNPARVSHYRLLGYENRALANQDFNDDTKDAGEIGAGHTVTALYEVIPTGGTPVTGVDALKYQSTAPGVDPLKYQEGAAPASTTPDNFQGEERIAPEPMPLPQPAGEWLTVKMRYKEPQGTESTKIDVPLLSVNGDLRETDADFRFASAVAAFGQVLRTPGYRHPSNFDRIVELARGAANGDADREAFVDLVITAKTLINNG